MARFAGTDFVPSPHEPQTSGPLKAPASAGPHTKTRNNIEAYLVEILGEPGHVLYSDPLSMEKVKKVRATPQILRHVVGLITILNNPTWNKVGQVLQWGPT